MLRPVYRILNLPLRRWRAKGHGIHSPYAYRLVTDTLASTHQYYLYDTIASGTTSRRRKRYLRLLIRLIARYNPSSVVLTADDPDTTTLLSQAVSATATLSVAHPGDGALPVPDMVIIPRHTTGTDYRLAGDNIIVIEDLTTGEGRRAWQQLGRIEHSMRFTDTRSGVIALSHSLPSQTYKIALK